tara:strand:- start:401 stop:1180 length:780 start_codon:yes stop_codon:yes gene_type:complete
MDRKFFSVEVEPDMSRDMGTTAGSTAFQDKDILFDWTPFDVPKGSCQLKSVEAIFRGTNGADQTTTVHDVELIFAKSIDGNAPSTLGVINAAVTKSTTTGTGVGWFRNIIGSIYMDATNNDNDGALTFIHTFSSSFEALRDAAILTGEPDSGTNVGFDKLYVAGIMHTTSGGLDFNTNVILDGNVAENSASVLTVGTTSALNVFQKGDVIVAQDGALAGTVKALTATSITLEANNAAALSNLDELFHKSPIRLQLGFEK